MPLATLHRDLPGVEHSIHQAISECETAENALGIDEKNALVDRVASSRHFAKAPKLQHFLRYIADHTFAGKTDLITETRIGIEVFKRKDTYHPGEDNIVRSYARTLRKRLDEFFVTDGKEEEYLLQVPRGGYALVVARRPEHQSLPENSNREHVELPLCTPSPTAVGASHFKRLWIPAVLLSTLLCSLLLGAYRMGTRAAVRSSSFNVHRFWSAFLSDRETLIVPSDTGLTMILGLTEQDVSIQQYVTNQHLKTLAEKYPQLTGWDRPISHRYSDFVDVEAVHQFDQTPEISGHPVGIQYARDLRATSFQSHDVILLGGHNANPWVDLYDAKLNFNLHFDAEKRTFQVINRHPLPGEPAVYPYQTGAAQPYAYGILAITPNETNTGNVLLLEGVTNSGLQAVVATLADETLMATIAGIVVRPDHSIQPAEFLVRTVGVGGESVRPEILGQRVDGTPGH